MILLAIDIQKGITDERLFHFKPFIENCNRIIDAARSKDIEVIWFQHDDGPGTGFSVGDADFEISDLVHPLTEEKKYIKTINSCFGNAEFTDYLKEKKEDTIVVIGLQTNWCIDATVKSGFERGYRMIVPQYANSTFDNDYMDAETTYRYYNEMIWQGGFAESPTVDEMIATLKQ